ncbi:MAG: xanthine dehydrogenase family protein subunit M [Rhodobacteraceae bacterium]|nr:xanthine dehydrogenase family protein subunit M [Paracoccaceae bacterium]
MQYHTPASFDEATALAATATGTTRFLAGGTDVLVQMRLDLVTPDVLIDVKKIAGVHDIVREEDGGWRIGIAVTGAEMSEHEGLCRDWPGLVEAMDLVGSTQVQGRATLTGNLCNASPAADSVPAMVAAGVEATVTGPKGSRRVPVEAIPTGPGKTSLARGEMISALHVPARVRGGGDAYLRFIPRTEMDIAVVGCGIDLTVEGETITGARMALGAVAPCVVAVRGAPDALVGTALEDAALAALADLAQAACNPIDDKRGTVGFRTHVAGVLARRVARIAYDRARENQ